MTERLYYDQTYLREFDATVVEARPLDGGRTLVTLDRSAFYPTSGGQPFDTGTLGGWPVSDVIVDETGEVRHTVEGTLSPGQRVHGVIDWARRFDHMQQHAGEHMIAGTIWRLFHGHTIGLHLGAEFSTIDVELPGGETHLTADQIALVENEVNGQIQRDDEIRCWFPPEDELRALPLRKPPTVAEHVRIVAIGDYEMVACGGTHPASTGQIGLAKIIDVRPSKGKARVAFVCGGRAFRNYQAQMRVTQETGALLSTAEAEIPEAVRRLLAENTALKREINVMREEALLDRRGALLAAARAVPGGKAVCAAFDGVDMNALRKLASALIDEGDVIALLGARGENGLQLVFARGRDVKYDMNALLKRAAAARGGRGGGKPDFAQGSAPDEGIMEEALTILREEATA